MINWRLYIESNSDVLHGKHVLKNTRIPVDLILEKLASGFSVEDIRDAFPTINRDAIKACLLFTVDSMKDEIVGSVA